MSSNDSSVLGLPSSWCGAHSRRFLSRPATAAFALHRSCSAAPAHSTMRQTLGLACVAGSRDTPRNAGRVCRGCAAWHRSSCGMPKAPDFDDLEDVLRDLRAGKMVIVTDDADRENEGDLVMAAEKVTPEAVNFMATHGRGLICAPITEERARAARPPAHGARRIARAIAPTSRSRSMRRGASPPASARTTARAPSSCWSIRKRRRDDLVQPGPRLSAARQGRRRAAPRGPHRSERRSRAARRPAARRRALRNPQCRRHHGAAAGAAEISQEARAEDLHASRPDRLPAQREKLVEREQVINLPTDYGDFDLHLYRSLVDGAHHLALVKGKIVDAKSHARARAQRMPDRRRLRLAPLRLRRRSSTSALQQIEAGGQRRPRSTCASRRPRHRPARQRSTPTNSRRKDSIPSRPTSSSASPPTCATTASARKSSVDLGVRKMRFLTNNPKKVIGLEGYGLKIVEVVPIKVAAESAQRKYLETKKLKMGHLL